MIVICSSISIKVVLPTSTLPVTAMSKAHSELFPHVASIIICVVLSTIGLIKSGLKSSSLTGLVKPSSIIISELLSSTPPIKVEALLNNY